MSLIQRIGTLRTLSFAVGVILGLVSAVYAQPGTGQLPAHRPGLQLALDHGPTVAGTKFSPMALTAATASMPPPAPRQWPCMDLVEEIESLFAALPNTRLMARVSFKSLTVVAVPWAFT